MNELKHTPGPWILGGGSGRMVTTPSGYVGDGFIADVDTLANACLIVVAPEMLAALELQEMADNELREHGTNPVWEALQKSAVQKRRAAIAKAKGELT
jgi:hypothetical protein